jgi:Fe-S cluster assembly scaffold protein SufB
MAIASASAEWVSAETVRALSETLSDPAKVATARRQALEKFRDLPLEPNPLYRKYGYFAGVDLTAIDPVTHAAPVPAPRPPEAAIRVLHDASGSRVSIPGDLRDAGVRLETMPGLWASGPGASDAIAREGDSLHDRLSALSLAILNRGYRLVVPDRCPLPVRVRDITVLSQPREAISLHRTIEAGKGSHLLVTEELFSVLPKEAARQRFFASSTDLSASEEARVGYLTLHAPDFNVVSFYSRHATLGRASRLAWVWAGMGGFRTRTRNRSFLPGNAAEIDDLQTFYGTGDQAYDSAVDITHIGTDTRGNSVTRGLFRDQSRGMSRGLVRIEKDARKTLSYLSEHAMLLSRGARSDTVPVLEILCRDVKATHSSSVAPVDPEKVFYLESRGFRQQEATRMIGEGFLGHVFDRAPMPGLREMMYPFITARWDGQPIAWREDAYPMLPDLELTGDESAAEWRFDAKLR